MKLQPFCNLKSILILMYKHIRRPLNNTESNDSSNSQPSSWTGAPKRVIEANELLGNETEIGIIHNGAMYRLRVTRGGKLILNK
jgi:hemin uptake protein HemP